MNVSSKGAAGLNMARIPTKLPDLAQCEMERCCAEGLSSRKTRLRLAQCGCLLPARTVQRRLAVCRVELKRRLELQQIGIGLGAVHGNFGPAAEVLRVAAPDWRAKHSAALRGLFDEYLRRPTPELFHGFVVGLYSLLVSVLVTGILDDPGAGNQHTGSRRVQ